MLNGALGSIEIQMLADLSRLRRDMNDAKSVVGTSMNSIKTTVVGAMGTLAAGMSVAAFTNWIKGAIDAGDEAFNMAQKVGVSVKEIAGLQLAFKQAGLDSGTMQKALVALSNNAYEGSEAFKRYGFSAVDASGKSKSLSQILGEVADVFHDMPEGIERTNLASSLFGQKLGADLIPMLEKGSAGIEEMTSMAERLGLVMSDEAAAAADEFNDTMELVGMASDGVALQVAAELLPTLKALAGTFLDNLTEGNKLAAAAEFIGNVLKGLFTVGAVGVEVFNTLGKTIGGVAGAVVAVASGEFSQAKTILEETGRDITKGWGDTAKTVSDLWTGAGTATVDQAVAMTNALGGTTAATREQAAEAKKAVDEQAKLTKAGQDYLESINAQYGAMQQQISLGRELTDGEKALLKMEEDLAKGKMVLTDAERASVAAKLGEMDATKEQKKQADEYAKTVQAVSAHATKMAEDQIKATESLRAGNVQLIEENERLRIGEAAWEARQATVMLNQAADLEWQAANEGGNFQLEEQARLLRERATLVGDGTALKEAKAVADEWAKTADEIGQGLTDSLFRAFEAGKGFFTTLWDGIKNLFKTTALKLLIEPASNGINSFISSALGGSGQAYDANGNLLQQGAQGASLYGGVVNAYKRYGSMWTGANEAFGSATGYASTYSGATYGTGFGTQQSAMLAGQEAGMGSAAGGSMSLGTMAWIGAAIMGAQQASNDWSSGFRRDQAKDRADELADRIGGGARYMIGSGGLESEYANLLSKIGFGDRLADLLSGATATAALFGHAAPQIYERGVQGTIGAGAVNAQAFANWNAEGGLFRSDKKGTEWAALESGMAGVLNNQAGSIMAAVGTWGAALGLPVEHLKNISTAIRVTLTGDAEADQKAVADAFKQYQTDLINSYSGALAAFQKAGETIEQTMTRLSALSLFTNDINQLGGVFSHVALMSVSAKEQLLEFAGGMEAFASKAAGFVANYYSQEEQGGLASRGILRALADVGIDASALKTRDDLRTMVEAIGSSGALDTETGREQLAVLLNVADSFAGLSEYLASNDKSLGQLAALAPETAVLQGLVAGDSARTANAVESVVTIGGSLVDLVTNLITSVQNGLAASTAAAQETTRILDSFDAGGYMRTTPP